MMTIMRAMIIEASKTFPVFTSVVPGFRTQLGFREKMTNQVTTAIMINHNMNIPSPHHRPSIPPPQSTFGPQSGFFGPQSAR